MRPDVIALAFGVVSLMIAIISRLRDPLKTPLPFLLMPFPIFVGVLPRTLKLSEGWQDAGSLTSVVLSFTVLVLLLRGRMRSKT